MPKISIDESLFAHINNDPFLLGSYGLQGNLFANTSGYLDDYLKDYQSNGGIVSPEIKRLLTACSKVVEVESDIGKARTSDFSLTNTAQKIQREIVNLKDKDYLLLPGGWRLKKGSHRIIYQIRKDEQGDYLFCVHNSGSGLEFHSKKSDKEKELYNPVLTYKIPKENIEKPDLLPFLLELFSAQVPGLHKQHEIKAEYLYQHIFPKLSYLGGVIVNDKDDKHIPYTAGQVSGTCSQHSLHQMLKSSFGDLDKYREFIYHFKAYSLDDYYKKLHKDDSLSDVKYHGQLEKAIRHQLRLLNLKKNNNSKEDLFPPQVKEAHKLKLLSYLSELRTVKKEYVATQHVYSDTNGKLSLVIKPTAPISTGTLADYNYRPVEDLIKVNGGISLFTELDEVIRHCQALGDKAQWYTVHEQLEQLLNEMPLPSPPRDLFSSLLPFYQAINSEEKSLVFYQKLSQLQDLYFSASQQILGKSAATEILPRMHITRLSIIGLTKHVNFAYPLVAEGVSAFPKYTGKLSGKIAPESPNSPYLASDHPKLDARLQDLRHLFRKYDEDKYFMPARYYQELINVFPELKLKLTRLYFVKYKEEESSTHKSIQEKAYESLYYFIAHATELSKQEEFAPLFAKFAHQNQLEELYSHKKQRAYKAKEGSPLNIAFDSSTLDDGFVVYSLMYHSDPLEQNKQLQSAKYNIESLPPAYALKRDIQATRYSSTFRASNETQLVPPEYADKITPFDGGLTATEREEISKRIISEQDLANRELFHLRRVPEGQIALTIDYFNRHHEKINLPAYAIYIEANLLQTGLLLDQLTSKKEKQFFSQFDSFVTNGLKYYEKKGMFTQSSLFYIRLAFLVNHYASEVNPELFKQRKQKFIEQLNAYIELQTNPEIIASLHQYRFLSLASSKKVLSPSEFTQTLGSYFWTEAHDNPQHVLDLDSKFQYGLAKNNFKRLLVNNKHHLNKEVLLDILNHLGFPCEEPERLTIEAKYPIYLIKKGAETVYSLNAEQGLVFKEQYALKTTPLDIRNHPLIKKFGLENEALCFTSPNEQIVLFEKPPLSIRFIKTGEGYRIQKKWSDAQGIEEWYELFSLSSEHAKQWEHTQLERVHNLNALMQERESFYWKNLEGTRFVLSDEANKIYAEGINNHDAIEITRREDLKHLSSSGTWIHQRLQQFEQSNFINLWTDHGLSEIDLERYKLKLQAGVDRTIQWTWEGLDYLLLDKTVLAPGVAHLSFQHENNEVCLLAIQPFYNSDRRSQFNEYYDFTHDTQGVIPKHLQNELIKQNKALTPCWNYSNTEQFMVLKVEKGEPIPSSAEEALYLAYVYLAANQPEKAWRVLEDCDKRLGGLKGTYKELHYLQWIIRALPYQQSDADEDATITTPSSVACQLKALSLYTHFSLRNKEIAIPRVEPKENNINDEVERIKIEEVSNFKDELSGEIYRLYSLLQGMRRELPAVYSLDDTAARSFLNYYHKNLNAGKAVGALGYEWVQLNLNQLRKEWELLQTRGKARILTLFEQQRLQEISQFLEKHEGVAKRSSSLVYKPLNLDLSSDFNLNSWNVSSYKKFNEFRKQVIDLSSTEEQKKKAINVLKLGISEDEFMDNLEHYLAIATTPNHRLQKPLVEFCKATLIAYRHDKKPRNISIFSNILYRLANKNKPLPEVIYASIGGGIESIYDLVNYVGKLSIPVIEIPELVDDTSKLLATAEEIWKTTSYDPIPIRPEIASLEKTEEIGEWLSPHFKSYRAQWHEIEGAFDTGATVARDLSFNLVEFGGLSEEEALAGTVKFKALKKLQQLAKEQLDDSAVLMSLKSQTEKKSNELEETLIKQLKTILALANQGPQDPSLKQQWLIDLASGKRKNLELKDLYRLYFHADSALYGLETGLSTKDINQLHYLLNHYVAQELKNQHCKRVLFQFKHLEKATESERENALYFLAQTLYAENGVDGISDPELNVFQLQSNILLRKNQQEALKRLLKTSSDEQFDETVEKIIMGGGKSKVILPTLAQKKANGNNLVIIEVPRALLRTNYIDLRATSVQLFNQDAYLFEFNRESDCSPERLEELFKQLNEVMVNKQYMVTTGEALQSLELKYLELLLSPPDERTKDSEKALGTWKKQVFWAERLITLFKQRGDLIIDEAHQGLLLKNKLNYTFGEAKPVSKKIIKHSIDLYHFLSKVPFANSNLQEQLIQRNPFTEDGSLTLAMDTLIDYLIKNKDSPIFADIETLVAEGEVNAANQIKSYFLNSSEEIPAFILSASANLQDKLAFYKEQVSSILPFTLKRQEGEHYGPSKLESRAITDRLIAIPYLANNVPSERSQFGNFLESMNYSIQSLLIKGIPQELLRVVLEDWIAQASAEIYQGQVKNIDETAIAALYRGIVGTKTKLRFSQLDPKDDQQLAELQKLFSRDSALLFQVLKDYILPKIKINDSILHSDAYSHVDMVRSCQCLTGTPWNYSTFHQRLHLSKTSSLGSDAYILKAIQQKKPTIHGIDFVSSSQFVADLFKSYKAKAEVRAIIDINASFKGIGNLDVAQSIVSYIQKHPEQFNTPEPIKYILFFNEKNELSALSTAQSQKGNEVIVLGSSDPEVIYKRLNCKPTARFTYFDQAHTVGADIKQASNGKALVLVDKNTHFQSFLQGSMRMRELLEGNQSVDLIVPKILAKNSFDKLVSLMVTSENNQLRKDNFNAARAKMLNIIRNDFMRRLLAISGDDAITEKNKFLEITKNYFVEMESSNFFERFGALYQIKKTKELLESHQEHLISDWQALMKKGGLKFSTLDLDALKNQMKPIIVNACLPEVCAPEQITRKDSLSLEVETQKEKQTEIEVLKQKQIEQEFYNKTSKPEAYRKWGSFTGDLTRHVNLDIKPLAEICKTDSNAYVPDFSYSLKVTNNFYRTFNDQTRYLSMFAKPAHALLFTQVGEKIQCVLLSQDEYDELSKKMEEISGGHCWITTTQHSVLAGEAPADIKQNKEYQGLIEQARYFNGEFNLLSTHDTDLSWLDDNYSSKLEFFTRYLWPIRETTSTDINTVSLLLSTNKKIYEAIANMPWIDHREVDWVSRFPDAKAEDLVSFQNVAAAFYEATKRWDTELNGISLIKEFNLALDSTGYFLRYTEQLSALKRFLTGLNEQCLKAKTLAKKDYSDIISQIPGEIITQLSSLSPAFKSTINSHAEKELRDYLSLNALVNSMPMCKKNPSIMQALARNSYISKVQLDELIKVADDPLILNGILNNRSTLINEKIIQHLINTRSIDDEDNVLALAQHSYLPVKHYENIIRQTKGLKIEAAALLAIIKRANTPITIIKEIVSSYKLKAEHIEALLKYPEPLLPLGTLSLLSSQVRANPSLSVYFSALEKRQLDEEGANTIEHATSEQEVAEQLVHETAGICARYAAVKQPITGESQLCKIAEEESDLTILTAIVARKDMQKSNVKRTKVCISLVKNPHLTQIDLLNDLALKIEDQEFVNNLLTYKVSYLEPRIVFQLISTNKVSDDALLVVARYAVNQIDSLIFILTHSANKEIIDVILHREDIQEQIYKDEELALTLVKSPSVPRSVILNLLNKITNPKALEQLFVELSKRSPIDEEYLIHFVKNKASSKTILAGIAKKTRETETLDAIVGRNDLAIGNFVANDKIYFELVNNPALASNALKSIALKTHSAEVLDYILTRIDFESTDSESSELLANILTNPSISTGQLTKIAAHKLSNKDIEKILKHQAIQIPSVQNDVLFKTLIKLNQLSLGFLTVIIQYMNYDEELQVLLVRQTNLPVAELDSIARKTNNSAILDSIWRRLKETSVATIKLKHTDDAIHISLANNPQSSKKTQLELAENLLSEGVAQALLNRSDMMAVDKDNSVILKALAESPKLTSPVLIQKIISLHNDIELLEALMIAKGGSFDSDLLRQLLNKPNLSEVTLSKIAQHSGFNSDALSLIAKSARETTTIDAILKRPDIKHFINEPGFEELAQNRITTSIQRIAIINHIESPLALQNIFDNQAHLSLDEGICQAFVNNIKTPKPILEAIAGRLHLLPNASVELLQKLSEQEPRVNEEILRNLFNRPNPSKDEQQLGVSLMKKSLEHKLQKLEANAHLETDHLLIDFIKDKRKQLPTVITKHDFEELNTSLNNTLSILNSPEVRAVQKTIERLNSKSGFLSFFMPQSAVDKANKIKTALLAVPLDERHKIANGQGAAIRKVQLALAEHRNPLSSFYHGDLVDQKTGAIKKEESADAFKYLESVIKNIEKEDETSDKSTAFKR